jgi:acyl carrier protein
VTTQLIEKMAEILECSPNALEGDADFRDHPHWDSLAALSTIAMLDSDYGVVVPQDEFESIQTLNQLEALIAKKVGS